MPVKLSVFMASSLAFLGGLNLLENYEMTCPGFCIHSSKAKINIFVLGDLSGILNMCGQLQGGLAVTVTRDVGHLVADGELSSKCPLLRCLRGLGSSSQEYNSPSAILLFMFLYIFKGAI